MPNVQNAQRPAGGKGFRIVTFPKEFEKGIFESIDRRFYLILLVSLALVYGWVIILGNIKYSDELIESRIRNNILNKFYEASIGEEPEVAEEEGEGFGSEEGQAQQQVEEQPERTGRREAAGTSAADRERARREAARQRGSRRSAVDQAVAGTGVLGELSSGSGGGSGDAVYDAFGDEGYGGGVGDLDQVLGSVSGLQSASSSSRRSRFGARESGGGGTGTAGIDDLIEGGTGPAGSVSIERTGGFSLKMEKASITGRGSRAADRSQDAISRVVNKHADAIENCYKKEVRLNPNLKGSVTIQFTINPNGTVERARIADSTLRNREVESCIIRRVRSWRFKSIDSSEGEVTFKQKYIFST
jgi:TonB family protein